MELDPQVKARHDALSPYAGRFLERAAADPAYRRPVDMRSPELPPFMLRYPYRLQSWPTFLSPRTVAEVARVNRELARLLRAVPQRLFAGDAQRIADYYRVPLPAVREILTEPSGFDTALARGDYLAAADGLQLVEMNLSAVIGGWQIRFWADLYRRRAYLGEFVDDEAPRLRFHDPFAALVEYIRSLAAATPGVAADTLNLAVVEGVEVDDRSAAATPLFVADYRRLLEEGGPGLDGELIPQADYRDFVVRDGRVEVGGRRVHAIVEHRVQLTPEPVLQAFKNGRVLLFNGPTSRILNDKRNLALLSEHADSELFDDGERRLIEGHLPWTREVRDEFTTYRGERVHMPTLLRDERRRMVLKHGMSARGESVVMGDAVSEELWRATLDHALAQGFWVAQERVQPARYLYQHGDEGMELHDVVWGLFAFGDVFGGGFLRVMPVGSTGPINSARGASEGIFYEAEPPVAGGEAG